MYLSVPLEAAKVCHEIDLNQSADKKICLSIMSNVFRSYDGTRALQECAKNFQGVAQKGEPAWRRQALINRGILGSLAEAKVAAAGEKLKVLGVEIYKMRVRKRELERAIRNTTTAISSSSSSSTPSFTSLSTSTSTSSTSTSSTSSTLSTPSTSSSMGGGDELEPEGPSSSPGVVRNLTSEFSVVNLPGRLSDLRHEFLELEG